MDDRNPQVIVVRRAVDLLGSQVALAKAAGVRPQFVREWLRGIRPVPAARCRAIAAATAGLVTVYDLRPDVFGTDPARDVA